MVYTNHEAALLRSNTLGNCSFNVKDRGTVLDEAFTANAIISREKLHRDRGGSRNFFRRGCTRLLLYFNFYTSTSTSINNSCIRKPQVISGGGGGGFAPPAPSS